MDVQEEIGLALKDIELAKEALAKAVLDRKGTNRDSPMAATLGAAVNVAKAAVSAAEVRLRKVYESKDDGG